jgi:hypothetical protein
VELRVPVPFPAFSLGRYGRVPARGAIAPFVHLAAIGDRPQYCGPGIDRPFTTCPPNEHAFPSIGVGYLLPFDVLRLDVARGLNRGRWMFSIDVSREFWSIL